jgi:hypothetical protein
MLPPTYKQLEQALRKVLTDLRMVIHPRAEFDSLVEGEELIRRLDECKKAD